MPHADWIPVIATSTIKQDKKPSWGTYLATTDHEGNLPQLQAKSRVMAENGRKVTESG
ncbi:hypothetical protein L903_08975 [Agrobacterium sp. JL28]|jgi:hypothetical protein|nr:hypothetical protein L902_19725 [Agrobacterium radiobacter DSM 30147]KVK43968.1 hypothetical protein L904_08640 [Agrobacterium sp. LY4]KVK44404.1 hypothetical protein L903_08975 [Agrobacterium sp. JL28]